MNYLRKISTNLVGLLIFSIILLNGLPRVYAEEVSLGSAEIRVESATPSESSGESGQQNSSTEPAKEKSQESDTKSATDQVIDNNTNPENAGGKNLKMRKKDLTNSQENGEKLEKDPEKVDVGEEIKQVPLGNPSQTPKTFTVTKRRLGSAEDGSLVGNYDTLYDAMGKIEQNELDYEYVVTMNSNYDIPENENVWDRNYANILLKSDNDKKYTLRRLGTRLIFYVSQDCKFRTENVILDGNNDGELTFLSYNGELSLGRGTIVQNFIDVPTYDGPAIYMVGNSKLNIEGDVTIQNNKGKNQGGVIGANDEETTINVYGGHFNNNSSDKYGGVISTWGILNIKGGTFENNKAQYGGAITAFRKARTSIENATFNNNESKQGGAILSYNDIIINKTNFEKNSATLGGAVFTAPTIKKNLKVIPKLKLSGSTFKNNTANSAGGALYLQGGAEINKSYFSENIATAQGGAVWANNSNINIDKTKFNKNRSGNFGGALCFNGDKTFSITNSSVIKNKSDLGGGIFALGGNLKVENTTIESNNATNTGGGILSLQGTSLSLNKVSIKSNTSPSGAGVVVGAGNVGIKESEFNGNDTGDGDNQEQRLGGGLYIGENANVNISKNTKFIDNKAGMGGAIFTENLDYKDPADTNKYKNLTIEDTTLFKGNIARVGLFYPPKNFKEFTNLNFSSDSDVKQNVGNRPSLLNNNDINYKSNTSRVTFINDDKVYKVVFVQNGKSIGSDDLLEESMPTNPTKAGYTFEKWNEKEDGKGENFNDTTIVNGDRLVYAIYKKNPPKPSDDRPGPVPDYRPEEKPEIPDDIKEADPGLKQDDSPIEKEKEKPNEKEAENTPPVLEVKDGAIKVGEKFDPRTLITRAYDKEDGSYLVDSVIIDQGKFDNRVAGRYEIQYSLIDKSGSKVTKLDYVDVLAKANKENLRNSRENPKTGVELGFALYSTIILLSSSAYTAIRKKY